MPIFSFELLAKTMGKGIPSTHQFVCFVFFFGGGSLCVMFIFSWGDFIHSFFSAIYARQTRKPSLGEPGWLAAGLTLYGKGNPLSSYWIVKGLKNKGWGDKKLPEAMEEFCLMLGYLLEDVFWRVNNFRKEQLPIVSTSSSSIAVLTSFTAAIGYILAHPKLRKSYSTEQ